MLQMAPWAVLFSSWWSWCGAVRQMWKFFLLLSFCLFFVWRKSPFYIALARVFAVKSSFFAKKNKKNHIYALLFQILLSLCIVNLKTESIMKELIAKIEETYAVFVADAAAQAEKGNKAAGTRARKASLELEKAMKAFRKASLEAAK